MGDLRPDPRLLKSGRALGSPARQLADGLLVVDDQHEGSGCHAYLLLAHSSAVVRCAPYLKLACTGKRLGCSYLLSAGPVFVRLCSSPEENRDGPISALVPTSDASDQNKALSIEHLVDDAPIAPADTINIVSQTDGSAGSGIDGEGF